MCLRWRYDTRSEAAATTIARMPRMRFWMVNPALGLNRYGVCDGEGLVVVESSVGVLMTGRLMSKYCEGERNRLGDVGRFLRWW